MTRKHTGKLHLCSECGWSGQPYSHGYFPGEHPNCNYLANPVHEGSPDLLALPCLSCFYPFNHPQHTDPHSVGYHRFVAVIPTDPKR